MLAMKKKKPPFNVFESVFCALCFLSVIPTGLAQEATPSVLLEKAIFEEETAGNVDEAVRIYRSLVDSGELRPAKKEDAMFRLGNLLGTLGRKKEADTVFQTYLNAFPQGVHSERIRERLQRPRDTVEIVNLVNLLGLWGLSSEEDPDTQVDYLELMPGGRYQRLPHPIDSQIQDAPSPAFETGTYEVDGRMLTMKAHEGEATTFQYHQAGRVLILEPADGTEIHRRRARRPFRFPATVDDPESLVTLMNLKAAEVTPVYEHLKAVDSVEAVKDLISFSGAVDAKLRAMAQDTTAELLIESGLGMLTMATDLFDRDDYDKAKTVLTQFSELDWAESWGNGDTRSAVDSYQLGQPDLVGKWRPDFEIDARTLTITGKDGKLVSDSLDGEGSWIFRGDRVFFEGADRPFGRFLANERYLAVYNSDGSLEMPLFRRVDSSLDASDLQLYFDGHRHILNTLLQLSRDRDIRKQMMDYYYDTLVYAEGTDVGFLARTVLRQLSLLSAAVDAGDLTRQTVIANGLYRLQGTMLRRLPSALPKLGIIVPNIRQDIPYRGVYEGSVKLEPTLDVPSDARTRERQIDLLRNSVLKNKLIEKTLASVPVETRDAYRKEFEGFKLNEIVMLLEKRLQVKAWSAPSNPRLIAKVAAFPHPNASVARTFGNQLGSLIGEVTTDDESWAWKIIEGVDPLALPNRLLLSSGYPVPPPAGADKARGEIAENVHSAFVFKTFIQPEVSRNMAVMTSGRFMLLQQGEHQIALRLDCPSWERSPFPQTFPVTVVYTDENGETVIEKIDVKQGNGPGGPWGGIVKGGVWCFCGGEFAPCVRDMDDNGTILSVAHTSWTDPKDIKFDDPSLRWYMIWH